MKKTLFSFKLLPVAAAGFLLLQSCQKTNNNAVKTPVTQQQELMSATNAVFLSGVSEGEDFTAVVASSDVADSVSSCATISFSPSRTVFPHQKIVDYGTGCVGADGHTRKGKRIVTVLTDPLTATENTELSEVTFENYYLDTINVTGVVKSYLISGNNPGPRVVKIVSEKSIFSPNGDKNVSNGTHLWTQTEGGNTALRSDDVYKITGHAEGTETLGAATIFTWTSDVDAANPLIKPVACNRRTQGGLNITIQLLTGGDAIFTEYLDYGDGTCDDLATLSINGGTAQQVTLPMFFWPLSL